MKLFWDKPPKQLLDLVERWIVDPTLEGEVRKLRRAVSKWARAIHSGARSDRDWRARWMVHCAADPKIVPPAQEFLQPVGFRPWLAEIFGDLTARPFDSAWRTPDVLRVAHAIYESRDFEALPALSDALLEAGCNDAELIAHCRGKGPHTRGCWALDLALGRD
jgi:hypothetical protein